MQRYDYSRRKVRASAPLQDHVIGGCTVWLDRLGIGDSVDTFDGQRDPGLRDAVENANTALELQPGFERGVKLNESAIQRGILKSFQDRADRVAAALLKADG